MTLRCGSLFSGVGGFDLGLERAGWEVLWQVEYDEQAQAVLRHHWPDADLHKDVCDVGSANLARVDAVCGGFPCQDLSVAGRRAGLAGERSGLFYEFMRIVDELAPRWVVIENVPGLLSSNGGRDMGAVLGTLGELGYGWTYRVLDSQYFGVAQRRRRVFIVGCAGGLCPPEVLLEPEGLPWNPAPRREARKGSARDSEGGVGGGGGLTANTLPTKYWGDPHEGTDRAEGHDASEDGTGRGTPIVADTLVSGGREMPPQDGDPMYTLQGGAQHGVLPFDTTQVTSKGNYSRPKPGDPCHPLASGAHPPAVSFALRGREGGATAEMGDDAAFALRSSQGGGDKPHVLDTTQGGAQHGVLPMSARVEMGPVCRTLDAQSGKNRGGSEGPKVLAAGAHPPSVAYHIDHDKNASEGRAGTIQAHGSGGFQELVAGPAIAVPRRLTPRECERLQGFPDDWTAHGRTPDGETIEMADSPRYRMLGNAVTVNVAEWIGRRIAEAHKHD